MQDSKKYYIWDNDASSLVESIKEENPEMDDYAALDEAYDMVDEYLEDTYSNLNIDVENGLIAIGNLERWNGSFGVHKDLGTNNIADAIRNVLGSYGGDNSFSVYVEDGELTISQTGHDNPTNPSIMKIREISNYSDYDEMVEELSTINTDTLLANTRSIAKFINEVYGWDAIANVG